MIAAALVPSGQLNERLLSRFKELIFLSFIFFEDHRLPRSSEMPLLFWGKLTSLHFGKSNRVALLMGNELKLPYRSLMLFRVVNLWLQWPWSGRGVKETTEGACLHSLSAHQKRLIFIYNQNTLMETLAKTFKIAKNAMLVVRAIDDCGSVVRAAEQSSHKIKCQNHDYRYVHPASV